MLSSLAHFKRLWTLEQVERMQNALIREGPTRGSSTTNIQISKRREASQKVQPLHIHSIHEKKSDIHSPAMTNQQTLWKGDVWNGIGNVDKITSVRAQQLDARVSAWQRATGGPTHTHRTAREELGHDVGAGGTTAPGDAAFFVPLFFPLPLPLPLGLD